MSSSILESTKLMLGIPVEHTAFDLPIIGHINTVLADLTQLGVGPEAGFEIVNNEAVWADFLGPNPQLNAVKSYVYMRVRLLFDPPSIGFVLSAMKEQIDKMEWKINVLVDNEVSPAIVVPSIPEEL